MSARYYWKPDEKGHLINITHEEAGILANNFDRVLDHDDIDKLEGIILGSGVSNPWVELIEAIKKHGSIRVWGED